MRVAQAAPPVGEWGMMTASMCRTAGVLVVLLLAGGLPAQAGTLEYRHGMPSALQQEVPYLGRQQLEPLEDPPDIAAAPLLAGEPVYFLAELGDEWNLPFVIIFDPEAKGGQGAIYFDLDNDGDLAEEQPLVPQQWAGGQAFGPIRVTLERDGSPALYHCWIQRQQRGGEAGGSWLLVPGCYNVGEITFEGETYRCAVVDVNGNGRFNDYRLGSGDRGDWLYVDWNQDGAFDASWFGGERVEYSVRYWREGRWYRPFVSADGCEASFGPGDFEFGTFVTDHEKFTVRFNSRTGSGEIGFEGPSPVQVPADTYGYANIWVYEEDEDGNQWQAYGFGEPWTRLEIMWDVETHAEFGPPFTARLTPTEPGPYRSGQTVTLNARLRGRDGKAYYVSREGRRPAPPKVVVRAFGGKELETHAMRRGGGFATYTVSWRIPESMRGKAVVAAAVFETGPFGCHVEEVLLEIK